MADAQASGRLYAPHQRLDMAERLLDLSLKTLVERLEDNPDTARASTIAECVKLLGLFERFHADKLRDQRNSARRLKDLMDLPDFDDGATHQGREPESGVVVPDLEADFPEDVEEGDETDD